MSVFNHNEEGDSLAFGILGYPKRLASMLIFEDHSVIPTQPCFIAILVKWDEGPVYVICVLWLVFDRVEICKVLGGEIVV